MVFAPHFSEANNFKSFVLPESWHLSNNLEGEIKAGIKHQPNFDDSDHGPLLLAKILLVLFLFKCLIAKVLCFCDYTQLLFLFLDHLL